MKQLLIRHPSESFSAALPYQTKQDMINVFVKLYIENNEYSEPLNTIALGDGLIELFSRDEYGCFFTDYGKWQPHIATMNEPERKLYLYFHVKRNAKNFWSEEPLVRKEFIDKKLSTFKNRENPTAFTPAFYSTTLNKLIHRKEWDKFVNVFGPSVSKPIYSFIFKV